MKNIEHLIDKLPLVYIYDQCKEEKIDPLLIIATCIVESNCDTYAMRYEPRWSYFHEVEGFAEILGSTELTERTGQATSWGLMQVMGTVAREHGFLGWFSQLCADPKLGIEYGIKHFKLKLNKYKTELKALAAYNAGSPIYTDANKSQFSNQKYVDKVISYYDLLD